jgi:hypothetical protein
MTIRRKSTRKLILNGSKLKRRRVKYIRTRSYYTTVYVIINALCKKVFRVCSERKRVGHKSHSIILLLLYYYNKYYINESV